LGQLISVTDDLATHDNLSGTYANKQHDIRKSIKRNIIACPQLAGVCPVQLNLHVTPKWQFFYVNRKLP